MADAPSTLDGVNAQPAAPKPARPPDVTPVKRIKRTILALWGIGYLVFFLWGFVLLALLPDPNGGMQGLKFAGVVSCAVAGFLLIIGAILAFLRINNPEIDIEVRRAALIRLGVGVVPGLIFALTVPFMITREPVLKLDITNPTAAADFVAPLAVTFSVEDAVDVLQRLGKRAVQYRWDVDGDGKVNQETVQPVLTATYEKEGIYTIQVRIVLSDGDTRVAARRMIINRSVFAITPSPPIVERPAVFSIAHLIPDKQQIKEIEWDFEGDGKQIKKTKEPEITHTYYSLGKRKVSAIVSLNNKTKTKYERTIEVVKAPPLPFPIAVITDPKHLTGNPKFGVRFRIETEEPLGDVEWDFGENEGEPVHENEAVHTFEQKGTYSVLMRARSASGQLAEIATVVRVVDELRLNDLTYAGTPELTQDRKIVAEAPLTVDLTPKTSTPFVQFYWEAPDATEVGSTEGRLQAIYRLPGEYTITLIGEDAENHVFVKKIPVEVVPPTSSLSLQIQPEGGVAPLDVTFDGSLSFVPDDTITGFIWSFGDRSDDVFGAAVVEHRYEEPGTYTIDLTVKTVGKKEYKMSKQIVVRAPVIDACILPSRTNGKAPLGVHFDAACTEGKVTKYLWDFGDGAQSDLPTPDHVFEEEGTYTVKLTVTGEEKEQTSSQTVTINVKPR